MNGKFLLDTPIVIALFAGDSSVREKLSRNPEVFVPSIVLGELYYGARKSAKMKANLERIDEFAEKSIVLACNAETSRQYGKIKQGLNAKGRPIPENDIWIAAVASQYGLTVVSRDDHFHEVDELIYEKW